MSKSMLLAVALGGLAGAPAPAEAQSVPATPAQSLAAKWNTICATAISGTLLFLRCDETFDSSAPLANLIAATGQRLDEIPGHARVATRDSAVSLGAVSVDVAGRPVAMRLSALPDGRLSLDARTETSLAAAWSLFFAADIGRVDRRDSPNEAAFKAATGSATAGIDWQLGSNWQVGVALNHVRENLDYTASDSEARTRFNGMLLTSSRSLGNTWNASAYYGRFRGTYDLSRDIAYTLPSPSGPIFVVAEALANPDARRRVSGIAVNGQWARRGWDLGVGLGLDNSLTGIDPYVESGGGGLALAVPARAVETRRGRIDGSIGRTFSHSRGVFQPSLRLGWRQEFSNPRRPLTVRLAQDPLENAITFDTEDPDGGWGEVALGGVFTFAGGHSGFFELRQRVAHSFLQERLLSLGWRIEM